MNRTGSQIGVIENQLLPLLSARQLRSHFVMKVFQVNTLKEFEFFNSLFLKKLFPKNFAFCVLLQQKPNISNYILNSYLNQLKNLLHTEQTCCLFV